MSMHIRIPLSEEDKRRLEDIKNGKRLDLSQFENDYDWDTYDELLEELYNPFEDVFALWCAYREDAGLQFWTSPLRYQFHSREDYLAQAAEYRKEHNLKPIDQLTQEDIKEYQEWRYKEAQKIRKKIFGDDYEMMG